MMLTLGSCPIGCSWLLTQAAEEEGGEEVEAKGKKGKAVKESAAARKIREQLEARRAIEEEARR